MLLLSILGSWSDERDAVAVVRALAEEDWGDGVFLDGDDDVIKGDDVTSLLQLGVVVTGDSAAANA